MSAYGQMWEVRVTVRRPDGTEFISQPRWMWDEMRGEIRAAKRVIECVQKIIDRGDLVGPDSCRVPSESMAIGATASPRSHVDWDGYVGLVG